MGLEDVKHLPGRAKIQELEGRQAAEARGHREEEDVPDARAMRADEGVRGLEERGVCEEGRDGEGDIDVVAALDEHARRVV